MSEKKIGRPRIHDREQIAIDIIEWAKKDDSINVNKFCAHYTPPFTPRKLSEWSKECESFRESYEIAKTFLAFRREEWVSKGDLHVKPYDLSATAYDFIIREEKDRQAHQEVELKKQSLQEAGSEVAKEFLSKMNRSCVKDDGL